MSGPIRTCIGCLAKKPKEELVRLVVEEKDEVVIDLSGKEPGRGAYLCPGKDGKGVSKECLEKAVGRKAFGRALRRQIDFKSLRELT